MKIQLSTSEVEVLRYLQRNLTRSSDYARMTCIPISGMGDSLSYVASRLGVDMLTVYRCHSVWLQGGADGLLENRNKDYRGLLDSHQLFVLRKELREHVYTNAGSVARLKSRTFGMGYTPQSVVALLNRIGFTYKKITEVPCEADAFRQEEFVRELAETLSRTDENSVTYYADSVLPTHNNHSTHAWIEKGEQLEQPTASGRDRMNINRLLNAHDVTGVIATDSESVNAKSTKELYQIALEKHPDARYYHDKSLGEWVKGTRISQIFLPLYSPNLNLIERLWKFLRKKVINIGFYRTKEDFRKAIRFLFDNIASLRIGVASNSRFPIVQFANYFFLTIIIVR